MISSERNYKAHDTLSNNTGFLFLYASLTYILRSLVYYLCRFALKQ